MDLGGRLNLEWAFNRLKGPLGGCRRGDLIHPTEMMGGGSRDGVTTPSDMAALQNTLYLGWIQMSTLWTPGLSRLGPQGLQPNVQWPQNRDFSIVVPILLFKIILQYYMVKYCPYMMQVISHHTCMFHTLIKSYVLIRAGYPLKITIPVPIWVSLKWCRYH